MQETRLSPGFSTIDEAVKLIQSDTRSKPVVDLNYLIHHLNWIETGRNFRIPKMRRLTKAEMESREQNRRASSFYAPVSEFESNGNMYVYIETNYDKELLRKVIREKFRELAGHEFDEALGRATSTVADDAQGAGAVRPRSVKPNTELGASIGSGATVESNGDGLNV